MSFKNLFKSLTSTSSRRRPARRPSSARLTLERLEERCLLTFGLAANYYVGSGQITVDAGDFNGDGHTDVASAGETGVAVLLNNGDGSLADGVIYPLGERTMTAAVGEVNGDGNLDLVATTWEWHTIYVPDEEGNWFPVNVSTGHVRVLLGDGMGSFTATATYDLGNGRHWDSALDDVDGDGNLDLAASNMDGPSSILLGNGDGTFVPPQNVAVGIPTEQVDLADLNGDGNLDWLVGNVSGNDVRLLLGNGDGTFQPAQTVATLTAIEGYANPSGQAVGDFNGDDTLDLAITYTGIYGDQETVYYDAYVQVFTGNGDGTFAPGDSELLGSGYIRPVEVADFDGDGNLDMVVGGERIGVRLLCGNGDGTFDSPEPPPVGMGGVPYDIVVADLDGNGEPDIATANQGSNISVLLNGDGPPPELSIDDVTITEGNAGTRAATFTVTLSAASEQPVTVAYDTSNGSAAAGADYQAASGTLTIPAGQTTATITVLIYGDRLGEYDETFGVYLSSPTNATIADRQATGTIVDDEPRISISDVTKAEGKKGQTTLFTFTVTLSAAYDQAVTMSFRTVNGTATTGNNDYVAKTGTLTFAPGETTKTITITVKGDSKREGNERFFLELYGLSSNGQFAKYLGIGLILNDD